MAGIYLPYGECLPTEKKKTWGFARDGNREEILAKSQWDFKFQVQYFNRQRTYRCEMCRMISLVMGLHVPYCKSYGDVSIVLCHLHITFGLLVFYMVSNS